MSSSEHPQSITDFDDVLEGRVPNGSVDYEGSESVEDLASRAGAAGWRLLALDGSAIADKASYLQAWCDAGAFPDTFGHNWDALADALTDLSWLHANGYVVLVESVFADEPWSATGREITEEACAYWAGNGTPFVVLQRSGSPV